MCNDCMQHSVAIVGHYCALSRLSCFCVTNFCSYEQWFTCLVVSIVTCHVTTTSLPRQYFTYSTLRNLQVRSHVIQLCIISFSLSFSAWHTGKGASTITIKGSNSNSSSSSSNSSSSAYIGCVWSEGAAGTYADYTLVAGFTQTAIHLQAGIPQASHTLFLIFLFLFTNFISVMNEILA